MANNVGNISLPILFLNQKWKRLSLHSKRGPHGNLDLPQTLNRPNEWEPEDMLIEKTHNVVYDGRLPRPLSLSLIRQREGKVYSIETQVRTLEGKLP